MKVVDLLAKWIEQEGISKNMVELIVSTTEIGAVQRDTKKKCQQNKSIHLIGTAEALSF